MDSSMFMNAVPGLAERRGEPLAFPLFGRGRILEPLVGDGIRVDNIAAASRYLCGPCSCQLKALNPGVDMLMDVDWEARLAGAAGMGGRGSAAPGGAGAAGGGMVADPSPVPAAGQSPPAASGTGGNRLPRHLTWVSGAVVLLLAAAAMAIIRKSR